MNERLRPLDVIVALATVIVVVLVLSSAPAVAAESGEDEAEAPPFAVRLVADGEVELRHDPTLGLVITVSLVNFEAIAASTHNAVLDLRRAELDEALGAGRLDEEEHAARRAELEERELTSTTIGDAERPWPHLVAIQVLTEERGTEEVPTEEVPTEREREHEWRPLVAERLVHPDPGTVAELGAGGGVNVAYGLLPEALENLGPGPHRLRAVVELPVGEEEEEEPRRLLSNTVELELGVPEERLAEAPRIAWRARFAFQRGRYDEALELAGAALAVDPDAFEAHLVASDVHEATGRLEAAYTACVEAEDAYRRAFPDAYRVPMGILLWCSDLAARLDLPLPEPRP